MSTHLNRVSPGDLVDFRGPVGRFKYQPNLYRSIGMVAGGTGLTPCLQVIRSVLDGSQPGDATTFVLYFQNRTEKDILLKVELDALVQKHKERLVVEYFLSNPSSSDWGNQSGWGKSVHNEHRGYISMAHIEKVAPQKCDLVAVCGPSEFNRAMKDMILAVGHVKENIFVW